MRFFLTGVLTMITCMVLHAADVEEGLIYYGDAKVAGREYVYVYQDSSLNVKKPAKIKKKKEETGPSAPLTENKTDHRQESPIVVPIFPFTPHSLFYLITNQVSATITQQRTDEYLTPLEKISGEKTYPPDNPSETVAYTPEQRQKLSITATQCGTLTSFGANYPPARFSVG